MKPRTVYYNEIDPYCCEWLRQLMIAGLIPTGDIDNRSIADVHGEDLKGYEQCHFFAGIGGWAYALYLADWPSDRPVWTGSCPCQPFSVAGKRKGTADKRHLWPEFYRLISEHDPATCVGEQVASKDGRVWLSGVRSDLETLGYAIGATDLCAAGVCSPHIRQRLYWVADSNRSSHNGRVAPSGEQSLRNGSDEFGGLAHMQCERLEERESLSTDLGAQRSAIERDCDAGGMGYPEHTKRGAKHQEHSDSYGRDGSGRDGAWSDFSILPCLDGKSRRVESGTFPLAHGVPARMGRLRAYGNAIVPQVAAEFIQTYCGVTS